MDKIVLTVCTAGRPEGLRRLLRELAASDGAELAAVVVVDNDPKREGMAVCEAMTGEYPWPLVAVPEPERGISSARNRAVREALALGADFVAVLDDDEWPTRPWLRELMRVQRETGADVVGGPVVPVPAVEIEHWDVLAPHYGLIRDLADGAPCILYGAGNFVARRECFEGPGGPFDRAFDRIGGEDLHFFQRLARQGARMRWAAGAVVYEETPPDRLTRDWLFMRQQRRGFIAVRVQRRLEPSPLAEASRIARTAGVLVIAGVRRLWGRHASTPRRLLSEMYWRYAVGRLRAHRRDEATARSLSHYGERASER